MAMIKTCKAPTEERTVSGSSVSFNSAFALPLKACKVSFSATQEGSGEPSPSNPRAISGVSAIGLNANSTPVSVSLGDTRYGGYVDLVRKKMYITTQYILLTENDTFISYTFSEKNGVRCTKLAENSNRNNGKCSHTVISSHTVINDSGSDYMWLGVSDKRIYWVGILDTLGLTDVNQFYSWIANNHVEVAVEYDTPLQIIDFSDIPYLSSIIGNNTFSTDTGTLEITFSDLQEKSASGAVATFNTALAMPLVECKTEFMCTQASGTPSPSNPLPITGVDDITIMANGNSVVIDLDGTRYGGYVDVVNKTATITWIIQKISDMQVAYHPASTAYPFGFYILRGKPRKKPGVSNVASEIFQVGGINWSVNYRSFGNGSNDYIYVVTSDYSSADDFKTNWGNYEFAYELATPIEISLSDIPTLSTIIGNNSFASDSGSIELTYKDLDIAKRGNFREVFKLP